MLKPAPDLPDNEIGRSQVFFVPYDDYNNSPILLEWNVRDGGREPEPPPYTPLAPESPAELKKLIGIECK